MLTAALFFYEHPWEGHVAMSTHVADHECHLAGQRSELVHAESRLESLVVRLRSELEHPEPCTLNGPYSRLNGPDSRQGN